MQKKGITRNRVLGAIGVLWGGAVLLSGLLGGGTTPASAAYAAGHMAGTIFGGLMFGVGLYYLIKG